MNVTVREWIDEFAPEACVLSEEDWDAAIVGIAERCGQAPLVVYDTDKCIEVLMARGLSDEEAWDYLSYNLLGAWVGEGTPLFLSKPKEEF